SPGEDVPRTAELGVDWDLSRGSDRHHVNSLNGGGQNQPSALNAATAFAAGGRRASLPAPPRARTPAGARVGSPARPPPARARRLGALGGVVDPKKKIGGRAGTERGGGTPEQIAAAQGGDPDQERR